MSSEGQRQEAKSPVAKADSFGAPLYDEQYDYWLLKSYSNPRNGLWIRIELVRAIRDTGQSRKSDLFGGGGMK
jgi:hypothetical protein